MRLEAVMAGLSTGAGLIMAIGAQNAFVLRQGLSRSHVAWVVAICALSDMLLIGAGVLGLGGLVQAWPLLMRLLQWGGTLFLGLYGWQALRRAVTGEQGLRPSEWSQLSRRQVVTTCLAFTWLNPHVYLDTVVLLGSLSIRYHGMDRLAYAAGASAASLLWFASLGYGARYLAPLFRRPLAWRILDTAVALFMLGMCLRLVLRPLGGPD